MDSTDWAAVAAAGSVAAAVGAFVAAGVTAWMAVKTRDLATATRDMAEATEKAVSIAQTEAREATHARINTIAPRVSVAITSYPSRPNLDDPDRAGSELPPRPAGTWLIAPGSTFTMPADQHVRLWFTFPLEIRNDGASVADVRVSGNEHADYAELIGGGDAKPRTPEEGAGLRFTLPPNGTTGVRITLSTTVEKMVTAWERPPEDGKYPPESKLRATVSSLYRVEQGAGDSTPIELTVHALAPVEGNQAEWVVRDINEPLGPDDRPVVTGDALLTERNYWSESS